MKANALLVPVLLVSCLFAPAKADNVLLTFDQPDEKPGWKTVNDNVMGGRSEGGFSFDHERGVLVFSGRTNTNGGGFSSIRTREKDWAIGDASGIEIRFRGDGRTYMADLRKKGGRRWVPLAWRASFKSAADGAEWQTLRIPFADFKATRMGRAVQGGAIEGGDVGALGFMIYDKKDGPFKLEVDWVGVYWDPVEGQSGSGVPEK